MEQDNAANVFVGDGNVGDREGLADPEGEVGEIEVVRGIAGERQPAGGAVINIVEMGVVEAEGGVHQQPRAGDRDDTETDEEVVEAGGGVGRGPAQQHHRRDQADAAGQEWDRQGTCRAGILAGVGGEDDPPRQAEEDEHRRIPGRDGAERPAGAVRQRGEDNPAKDRGDGPAADRVEARRTTDVDGMAWLALRSLVGLRHGPAIAQVGRITAGRPAWDSVTTFGVWWSCEGAAAAGPPRALWADGDVPRRRLQRGAAAAGKKWSAFRCGARSS